MSLARGLAPAPPAQAQAGTLPDEIELSWRAPAGCPRIADLRAALAASLPASGHEHWPSVRVDAHVSPQAPAGFRLRLRFAGERSGERSVEASSCDGLARAAAVLIVLAIETAGEERATAEPSPPREARVDDTQTGNAGEAGSTVARYALGASMLLDAGSMPRIAAGAGASARLLWSRLEIAAAGAFFPGTQQPLAGDAGEHVRFELWELLALGCYAWGRELRAGPCAGVALFALTGASREVLDEDSRQLLSAALEAGATLRVEVGGPLSLRVDARGRLPLRRARWSVRDYPFRYQPAALAARLSLGVELSL